MWAASLCCPPVTTVSQLYAHARKKAMMTLEKLATGHLCSSKQMVWLSSSETVCVSGTGGCGLKAGPPAPSRATLGLGLPFSCHPLCP